MAEYDVTGETHKEQESPAKVVQEKKDPLQEDHRSKQFADLDRVIGRYSRERGQLIRILQKAQEIFGYLPEEVQAYIAEKIDIPVSEVNGVVTFYSLFATEPKGKYTLNICMGTACYVKGAQTLMNALKEELKIDEGETTPDGVFTIKSTRCVGACGLAPILVANEDVHGKISPGEIKKIIQTCRKGESVDNKKH
ncbi:MAG: NAD(P)H-dependent oxidoreductase subunit E [Pelotomaculaceae bacterium]|nr:NAD(P)H-dependent oxidoreductase subunit E [Bacillota bacterium]HHU86500.1 NAD(P)H-dependent oxidoreductase subunit E [Peptococcaceae bacterium]